ncbi:MAG: NAD-dependent epimerase/dehydratase family protein [Atopobiaceae bacterium]|nr:NAD-dependent epimerase/dehydratase family protein [Atopobiaceae bacterium]
MDKYYDADLTAIAQDDSVPWSVFEDATVVVTGATGLVGGMVVRALLRRCEVAVGPARMVLPVRNLEKARAQYESCPNVEFVEWDAALGKTPRVEGDCDYVVHCASNTDSRLMVEKPVDTIDATVEGTRTMLELARSAGARMCFVSSMEVYGSGSADSLDETRGGELDAMSVRSSYPQAKQLAETLCASYASQYGVRVCVARLAQSFGPGIANTDKRVFAEFARCCERGEDIRLLTDGTKSNMYVYTADAVVALLLLVACGESGEAYNVANEQTFCSIWEMANMVANAFGSHTKVTRVQDRDAAKRFAVTGCLRLNTSKIHALGWEPKRGLEDMYRRMMADWK